MKKNAEKQPDEIKKYLLRMPIDMHRKIRHICFDTGEDISTFIVKILAEHLKKQK